MDSSSSLVPPLSHEIWEKILSDEIKFDFEFLATKILLARLKLTLKLNPDPSLVEECAAEIRQLFVKTERLPTVKRDLKKIIKGGKKI
ncbi:MAG: hypothetical protein GF353_07910 [Candidatus Lokiarchaeota archaeon]|nr:hypothetical protein [Candidatus Lokiarchaeota archaeon]